MANCDIATLLADARCFECLSPGEQQIVELQLLCQIAQSGGGGGTVNCDPIAARVVDDTGSQTCASGAAYDAVEWNVEDIDTDNMVDLGANANIITIQETGIYSVSGAILWNPTEDAAATRVQMIIWKNGNIPDAVGSIFVGSDQVAFDNTIGVVTVFNTIVQLNAGDFLWLGLFQNSGQSLLLGSGGNSANFLSASKIVGCQASA